MTTGQSIVGPYRIAHYDCEAYGLLTNKCPQGPYRGVGTVQGIFIIERLMDMVADRLGLDPVEIRRRNLIQSHEFPYATPAGRLYDSGDYLGALEVLRLADYDQWRRVQAEARATTSIWVLAWPVLSSIPVPARRIITNAVPRV